jgi:hypothetical protein
MSIVNKLSDKIYPATIRSIYSFLSFPAHIHCFFLLMATAGCYRAPGKLEHQIAITFFDKIRIFGLGGKVFKSHSGDIAFKAQGPETDIA